MVISTERTLASECLITEVFDQGPIKMVHLSHGSNQGVLVGATYSVYRKGNTRAYSNESKILIETGRVKVIRAFDSYALAEIVLDGTSESRSLLEQFPTIMRDDLASVIRPKLVNAPQMIPDISMSYFELFYDPKRTTQNFELTPAGKALIQKQAAQFQGKHLKLLMVLGHTERSGKPDENRLESYRRARVVRQYLIKNLRFDADRVTAIGVGGQEDSNGASIPGIQPTNRRIALQAATISAVK